MKILIIIFSVIVVGACLIISLLVEKYFQWAFNIRVQNLNARLSELRESPDSALRFECAQEYSLLMRENPDYYAHILGMKLSLIEENTCLTKPIYDYPFQIVREKRAASESSNTEDNEFSSYSSRAS